MTDKLVLVDVSSVCRPIFEEAYPKGMDIANNCHVAMVAKIRALASAHAHVALCCDSGKSFRHELDANYKANRTETPAVYLHQIAAALDVLRRDGTAVWSEPGYEADDLIATAVRLATTHSGLDGEKCSWCGGPHSGGPEYCDVSVLIISADKDLTQLVRDRVTQFKPANGPTPEKLYDVAEVERTFGVAPHQMVDWLSLVGDKSDNVIGADKIGPVKASALLKQFGNLDDLYAAIDGFHAGSTALVGVPPSMLSSLVDFRPRLPLVRSLIQLRTDAPIPFEEIFKPRVPVDAETFGDDIEFAMQPLPENKENGDGLRKLSSNAVDGRDHGGDIPTSEGRREGTAGPLQQDIRNGVQNNQSASAGPQSVAARAPDVLPAWDMQFEPTTIAQLKDVANVLFQSGIFSAWGSPQAVFAILQAGRELGMKVQQSLRAFHNIENKPSMHADLIRALVLKSNKAQYFVVTERTPEAATFKTHRKGDPEPVELRYTMAQAQASGRVRTGSGYSKDPSDMLVARAGSKLARLVYPDVVHGLIAGEEMSE